MWVSELRGKISDAKSPSFFCPSNDQKQIIRSNFLCNFICENNGHFSIRQMTENAHHLTLFFFNLFFNVTIMVISFGVI